MRKWLAGLLLGMLIATVAIAVFGMGAVTLDLAAVLRMGGATVGFAVPVLALAILMALVWAAKLLLTQPVSWKQSPMHLPVLGFFVYTFIRYLTSPIPYESRLELFRVGLYAFIYFVTICNLYRSRHRTALLAALISLAVAESLYGFWQVTTNSRLVLWFERVEFDPYQHRGSGTYVNPNHLAGFLEMVLGLMLARIFIFRSSKGPIQKFALNKVFMIYAGLLIMAGVVTTFSRAAWLSCMAGFVMFLLLKGWRTRTIWPRVAVGVSGMLLAGFIAFKVEAVRNFLHISLAQQAEKENLRLDPSLGSRVAMWIPTLNMIRDHPLVGSGPGTWKWFNFDYRDPTRQVQPDYAHNDFLHLASDYGLVGFALGLAFLAAFFWHASQFLYSKNPSEERSFAMGSIVAMIIILVHSLFDFNLHIPANALVLCVIAGTMGAMDDAHGRFRRLEMVRWQKIVGALVLIVAAGVCTWFYGRTALAQYHTSKGLAYQEAAHFEEAVAHYNRAIEIDPDCPEPYYRLGETYAVYGRVPFIRPEQATERRNMLKYAVDMLYTTLELNPYQPDAYVQLAVTHHRLGDLDNALIAFDKALAVDRNSAFAYFMLGKFYRDQGELAKAMNAFKRADQLNVFHSDRGIRLNLEELRQELESLETTGSQQTNAPAPPTTAPSTNPPAQPTPSAPAAQTNQSSQPALLPTPKATP